MDSGTLGDLRAGDDAAIEVATAALRTTLGYLTAVHPSGAATDGTVDSYHLDTVWPFEQALIHAGARRLQLDTFAEVRCYTRHSKTAWCRSGLRLAVLQRQGANYGCRSNPL